MILVASIFYGGDNLVSEKKNKLWLELQQRFLKQTTTEYDHAVYLNSVRNRSDFAHLIPIGWNDRGTVKESCFNHLNALKKIVEYCRHHDEYDRCLILDSDAFPINPEWQQCLDYRLNYEGFNLAAVVRYENLDLFPHPSAMYFNRQGIEEAEFIPVSKLPTKETFFSKRVLEFGFYNDPTLDMPFFPMIRSNVWNPHPITAGVYHDLFFHMSAGSRFPTTRSSLWKYHRRHIDDRTIGKEILEEIERDAKGFIAKLRFGSEALSESTVTAKDMLI
jgi:hypothetical protein